MFCQTPLSDIFAKLKPKICHTVGHILSDVGHFFQDNFVHLYDNTVRHLLLLLYYYKIFFLLLLKV